MGGQTDQINHERFHMYLPVAVLDACHKLNMGYSLHTNGTCNYKGSEPEDVKLHITRLKDYICFTTAVTNIKISSSQGCVVTVPEGCKLLECFKSKCESCSDLQPPPNNSHTHQDIEDNSPDPEVPASSKNDGEQQLLFSEAGGLNLCSLDEKIKDENLKPNTGFVTMVTDRVTRSVTNSQQGSSQIRDDRCSTQDEKLSTAGESMNVEDGSETYSSEYSAPKKGGATSIRTNSQEIKACKTKSRYTLSNRVSVSSTGSHICEMCSKSFTSTHQLYRHRAMKHASAKTGESIGSSSKKLERNSHEQPRDNIENNQSVLCPKCGKCFRTHRAVSAHLASVHGKQWPFKCDSCERVFKLQRKLESHCCASKIKAERHSSGNSNTAGLAEDRGSVSCPLCDTIKASYNALYKHLLSKHKQHPRYEEEQAKLKPMMRVQCDRCGLDFSTSTNLRKHMKLRKCSDNPSAGMKSGQPCPFCAKISASMTHLAQHMQLMHRQHPQYEEEEKRLRTVLTVQCETCGNWYPDKASWRQHYTNAHAEDRHRCPHCRKPFRLESHMQVHINHRHLGVPYKKSTRRYFRTCKHCPKTFLTKDELDKHVKLDHRDRKQIHQCDKCSFRYSEAKEYFLHHRKMHSNEGIRCSHCGSTFTSVWFLRKHLKGCTEADHLSGTQKEFEGQVGMQDSHNEDNHPDVENQQVSSEYGTQSPVIHAVHKEKVIQVIPIITPESAHNYSQNVRQPTETSLQLSGLSDVFSDCVVNQVSQVKEVTIDANNQIVEGTETNNYQPLTELRCEDFQVVEDNVVTSEQVIYLASGTSLDASQLPIGTVIETADVTIYWNGT